MRCPFCQHTENRVLESRSAEGDHSVRRRRECLECKRRFTTYERIELMATSVVKRNGDRELFDRSKVVRGMLCACAKTGITEATLTRIVEELEADLQQRRQREISSDEIGDWALRQLRKMSDVAYIRFASVFEEFRGIDDFSAVLKRLQPDSNLGHRTDRLPAASDEELHDRAESPAAVSWMGRETTRGHIGLSPR